MLLDAEDRPRSLYDRVMRTSRMVLMIALLWTATGCFSKPVASLHSVKVRAFGPQGVGLDMVMQVRNDNLFDVQVREVRCSVLVAEEFRLPAINYNPQQWLPAGRSTYVHVPVVVPWPMVTPMLAHTVGSDTVEYQVRGWVDVTAVRLLGIRRNDHPFDDDGEVSRAQLLQAAVRGMGSSVPRRPY